ncbi:hypothetical protein JW824_08400 [bacterium]|nr:hypothetical protein [bacterium]
MKKFDRYSIRGVVITLIAFLGIGYEMMISQSKEIFVIILYTVVVFIGFLLLFIIEEPKT